MAADLHPKKESKSFMEVYTPYIILLCLIVLVFLIIALVMVVTGVHANTLTGSEANHWQNLQTII